MSAEDGPSGPSGTVSVLATLRHRMRELHPGEKRVATLILDRADWVIEATLAEVAEAAGVSGATVVRTAQRLGYRGFPHLRVMLARDAGAAGPEHDAVVSSTPAGEAVLAHVRNVARSAEAMEALIDPDQVERAVELLATASRVLVVGNGVSAPVAADLAMRLSGIGRPADAPSDHLDQQIRAGLLAQGDLCVVVSGTGASRSSLRSARAAAEAGAGVLSLTALAGSPLSDIADAEVLVGPPGAGFSDELRTTSRLPQFILNGALVAAVRSRDLPSAAAARARVLDIVAGELVDES